VIAHGKALLNLHEVAEKLFGEDTPATYRRAYRLVQGNQIRYLKSGSRYFVPATAIEELTGSSHSMDDTQSNVRPFTGVE
jgi:hypothetical protein